MKKTAKKTTPKTKKSVSDTRPITERVKSFEDACGILKINTKHLPDVSKIPSLFRKSLVAGYMLSVIHAALNEGWKADQSDHYQVKYSNWFVVVKDNKKYSGFGFSNSDYEEYGADTTVAASLLLRSPELALYSGKQFAKLHLDHLVG